MLSANTKRKANNMKHTLKTLERDGIQWEDVLAITTKEAKALWADHRGGNAVPLLTAPDANQKIAKDGSAVVWSLSLAPHRDGGTNVCPASTPACRKHCVSYSGKGSMNMVQRARANRTSFLMTQPAAFVRLLVDEIDKGYMQLGGVPMGVRLNAFSDIAWERVVPWLFGMFADVSFYDYTKRLDRSVCGIGNYSLTVSASEKSDKLEVLPHTNVAVIFTTKRTQALPIEYRGFPVIDGDKTDFRFNDPQGVIVGLRAKGTLRQDNSLGFAVQVSS